jgi:hypothetical protein
MDAYVEPSLFSGKKGLIFGGVVLLHALIGYAFYSGLAAQCLDPPDPKANRQAVAATADNRGCAAIRSASGSRSHR